MHRPEWAKPLQQLMGAVTEAHKVLADETLRGNYDRKLTHRQTEAQETLEECVKLAAKAVREENREGAIFWMRKCVNIAPEVAKYRVSLATSMTACAASPARSGGAFSESHRTGPMEYRGLFKFRRTLRTAATAVARGESVFEDIGV